MNPADSIAIVTSTLASLKENFTGILPLVFPAVIVVAVLFYAWRKVHGLAKGRAQ